MVECGGIFDLSVAPESGGGAAGAGAAGAGAAGAGAGAARQTLPLPPPPPAGASAAAARRRRASEGASLAKHVGGGRLVSAVAPAAPAAPPPFRPAKEVGDFSNQRKDAIPGDAADFPAEEGAPAAPPSPPADASSDSEAGEEEVGEEPVAQAYFQLPEAARYFKLRPGLRLVAACAEAPVLDFQERCWRKYDGNIQLAEDGGGAVAAPAAAAAAPAAAAAAPAAATPAAPENPSADAPDDYTDPLSRTIRDMELRLTQQGAIAEPHSYLGDGTAENFYDAADPFVDDDDADAADAARASDSVGDSAAADLYRGVERRALLRKYNRLARFNADRRLSLDSVETHIDGDAETASSRPGNSPENASTDGSTASSDHSSDDSSDDSSDGSSDGSSDAADGGEEARMPDELHGGGSAPSPERLADYAAWVLDHRQSVPGLRDWRVAGNGSSPSLIRASLYSSLTPLPSQLGDGRALSRCRRVAVISVGDFLAALTAILYQRRGERPESAVQDAVCGVFRCLNGGFSGERRAKMESEAADAAAGGGDTPGRTGSTAPPTQLPTHPAVYDACVVARLIAAVRCALPAFDASLVDRCWRWCVARHNYIVLMGVLRRGPDVGFPGQRGVSRGGAASLADWHSAWALSRAVLAAGAGAEPAVARREWEGGVAAAWSGLRRERPGAEGAAGVTAEEVRVAVDRFYAAHGFGRNAGAVEGAVGAAAVAAAEAAAAEAQPPALLRAQTVPASAAAPQAAPATPVQASPAPQAAPAPQAPPAGQCKTLLLPRNSPSPPPNRARQPELAPSTSPTSASKPSPPSDRGPAFIECEVSFNSDEVCAASERHFFKLCVPIEGGGAAGGEPGGGGTAGGIDGGVAAAKNGGGGAIVKNSDPQPSGLRRGAGESLPCILSEDLLMVELARAAAAAKNTASAPAIAKRGHRLGREGVRRRAGDPGGSPAAGAAPAAAAAPRDTRVKWRFASAADAAAFVAARVAFAVPGARVVEGALTKTLPGRDGGGAILQPKKEGWGAAGQRELRKTPAAAAGAGAGAGGAAGTAAAAAGGAAAAAAAGVKIRPVTTPGGFAGSGAAGSSAAAGGPIGGEAAASAAAAAAAGAGGIARPAVKRLRLASGGTAARLFPRPRTEASPPASLPLPRRSASPRPPAFIVRSGVAESSPRRRRGRQDGAPDTAAPPAAGTPVLLTPAARAGGGKSSSSVAPGSPGPQTPGVKEARARPAVRDNRRFSPVKPRIYPNGPGTAEKYSKNRFPPASLADDGSTQFATNRRTPPGRAGASGSYRSRGRPGSCERQAARSFGFPEASRWRASPAAFAGSRREADRNAGAGRAVSRSPGRDRSPGRGAGGAVGRAAGRPAAASNSRSVGRRNSTFRGGGGSASRAVFAERRWRAAAEVAGGAADPPPPRIIGREPPPPRAGLAGRQSGAFPLAPAAAPPAYAADCAAENRRNCRFGASADGCRGVAQATRERAVFQGAGGERGASDGRRREGWPLAPPAPAPPAPAPPAAFRPPPLLPAPPLPLPAMVPPLPAAPFRVAGGGSGGHRRKTLVSSDQSRFSGVF